MAGDTDSKNLHFISRGYDEKLINTAASCLLYMLSDLTMNNLMHDKELTDSYKREPTKANYDALIQSVRRIKSPIHSENNIPFAHGIFIVLEHVFEGVWMSVKASDSNLSIGSSTKQEMFKVWAKYVAAIIEDMADGIHGKGDDASEEVRKKWEEQFDGNSTDLRSDS